MTHHSSKHDKRRLRIVGGGLLLALTVIGFQGCSSVPDAANPVEWYKGARDWITGSDDHAATKKAEATAPPIPGEDRPFPKLSSVPERPKSSTGEERKKIAEGLVADRENARYTDEVIRLQAEALAERAPLPPKAPTSTASVRTGPSVSSAAAKRPAAPPNPKPAPRPQVEAVSSAPTIKTEPARPPAAPPAPRRAIPPRPNLSSTTLPPPPSLRELEPPLRPEIAKAINQTEPARSQPLERPTAPTPPPPLAANPANGVAPLPPLAFGPPPGDIAIVQERRSGIRPPSLPAVRAPPAPQRIALAQPQRSVVSATPIDPNQPMPGTRIGIIWFDHGSTRLDPEARRALRQVAAIFRSRGGRLNLTGHASSRTRNLDPVAHTMANFAMSLDRANAVAAELARLGVSPELVDVRALSDARALYLEVMPAGESGNRRVEIFLEGGS